VKARVSRNLVGTEVRRKRCEKDWSQERLAEECQDKGWNVTRGHIAKIESGEICVTDVDYLMLSAVFDVSMEDLMPRICVSVKRKNSESLFIAIHEHTGGCLKTIMPPDKILAERSAKLLDGHKINGVKIVPNSGQKSDSAGDTLSA
jgi:hypothetical protein